MLLCFIVKKTVIWYKYTTATTDSLRMSANNNSLSILASSHDRAQNDNRPYHFCAKNEYTDGQFLASGCGSRQRQVADGADGPMLY